MAVCPLLGPKCSVYYMVISVWGVVMLGLMGVFFYIRSPSLFEDANISESEWEKEKFSADYVKDKYESQAYNCWIAAGLYVAVFIFSFIQQKLNSRVNYEMS
ncbi:ribonuclease kappa [Aplysia californica]|uniref:Ribonuclease kappa n=1 Tax=Aplysia californica TaxID=6500 RepID=A0ABM0JMC6_APLCA|nr:ribonuclease kappa [Aplysia californica]